MFTFTMGVVFLRRVEAGARKGFNWWGSELLYDCMKLNDAIDVVCRQTSLEKMVEEATTIHITNKSFLGKNTKENESSLIDFNFGSIVLPILSGAGPEIDRRSGQVAKLIRVAVARVSGHSATSGHLPTPPA